MSDILTLEQLKQDAIKLFDGIELRDKYYLINEVLSDSLREDINIQIVNDEYFVFSTAQKNHCAPEKYIQGKYKTKDTNEVLHIIASYVIESVCWSEIIDRYSSSDEYITYDSSIEDFEVKFKKSIIEKLPEFCKQYFTEGYDVYNKMENFLDSNEYYEWMYK